MNDIINIDQLVAGFHTGGQPTVEQLASVKAHGIELVINLGLLGTDYALADERKAVESLGMGYVHIPVDFQAPTLEDFRQFETTLLENAAKKVLVHCAMNLRATSFAALFARFHRGWSEEASNAYRCKFWEPNEIWSQWAQSVETARTSGAEAGGRA